MKIPKLFSMFICLKSGVSFLVMPRLSLIHFTVTLVKERLDKFSNGVAVSSKRIKLKADS